MDVVVSALLSISLVRPPNEHLPNAEVWVNEGRSAGDVVISLGGMNANGEEALEIFCG